MTNQKAEDLKNQGNEYAKKQDWQNAEQCYLQALKVDNNYLDVLNNLAGVMAHTGRLDDAKKYSKRILEIDNSNILIRTNLAKISLDTGDLNDAVKYSKEIIEIDDTNITAYKTLALASEKIARGLTCDFRKLKTSDDLLASKELNQAKKAYLKVIEIASNDLSSIYRYFNILSDQQKHDDVSEFLISLKHNNNTSIPHLLTYTMEKIAGIIDETTDIDEENCDNIPTQKYEELVDTLIELGRNKEAIPFQEKITTLSPNSADALNKLGKILELSGKVPIAENTYRKALAIDKNHIDTLCNLGHTLRLQDKTAEMMETYQKVLQINPSHSIGIQATMSANAVFESKEEIKYFRENMLNMLSQLESIEYKISDPISEIGTTNFYLSYQGLDNLSIQKRFASFFIKACPSLIRRAPHLDNYNYNPKRKIKIGFYSKNMKLHTIGHLMLGILENLSKEKFSIHVYHPANEAPDIMSQRIDKTADKVVRLPNNLSQARNIIFSHELDIMFFPDIGMEPFSYFLAFAKLAKKQCVYWGHPETTGIPNMDYFISSKQLETEEDAEKNYSEKLIKTENFLSYYNFPDMPRYFYDRNRLKLPNDKKLYVCSQSLFKIHPDYDQILHQILKKDENALIVFISNGSPNWAFLLLKRFKKSMGDIAERIVFVPKLKTEDFLSLLKTADVLLDPIYFSGGKTSFESLAVGNLVVTMHDKFMRSRITDAYYKTLDISCLTAKNTDDYVNIAYRIANNTEFKNRLISEIKRKFDRDKTTPEKAKTFNNINAIRELENIFENMLING